MGKRVWTIETAEGSHTVELEHGYWSGQRVIRVDGQEVVRDRKLLDYGSSYAVPLGQQQGGVVIKTNGITFNYDLVVDGKSMATGKAVSALALPGPLADTSEVRAATHEAMLGEIRSWSLWQLGLGLLHLIGGGFLNAPWGLLLIAVGLGSFVFKDATIFVVYAVTLVWAGLSNVLTGEAGRWTIAGLFQFYLAFQVFRRFFVYNKAQVGLAEDQKQPWETTPRDTRAASVFFPWGGFLFSVAALLGVVGLIVLIFGMGFTGRSMDNLPSATLDFIAGMLVNVAVLGFGLSLASLMGRFRYRPLAVIGIIASLIVLGLWVFLVVGV